MNPDDAENAEVSPPVVEYRAPPVEPSGPSNEELAGAKWFTLGFLAVTGLLTVGALVLVAVVVFKIFMEMTY